MTSNNIILFPIFIDCLLLFTRTAKTPSDNIKCLFQNLAYGTPPYGTYFNNNGYLCCKLRKREFSIDCNQYDVPTLTTLIPQVFEPIIASHPTHPSHFSNTISRSSNNAHSNSWRYIRKQNIRHNYLCNYIHRMSQIYNLDSRECKELLHTIVLALFFKLIHPHDIHMSNNQIDNIKGISFTPLPSLSSSQPTDQTTRCNTSVPVKWKFEFAFTNIIS